MEHQEEIILNNLVKNYKKNEDSFIDKVNELTGIHIIIVNDNGNLLVLQDCGGMKASYYGIIDNNLVITSHPQLVADFFNLNMEDIIKTLINKWFYHLGGGYLPGDLSPYKPLKRQGPNTLIRFNSVNMEYNIKRFYPKKEHPELKPEEYDDKIDEISDLLNRNIELCSKKWNRPAISLSGGVDSRTTLAFTNGFYDRFQYYSFQSKEQEEEDANAANKICQSIGLKHNIYDIPNKNESIKDFKELKKIIFHNSSYIGEPRDNEIRKFIYLNRIDDFDVELKSWISEIGRYMWEKKYNLKLPEILTPRHFSIFESRYFAAPKLLNFADQNYKDYLKRIDLYHPPYNYDHADFFYWEFRFGSWGSNVVTTQDIFDHTVTMPFNNRKIIDMFLWFPKEYRKKDKVNKNIIKKSNKNIYKDKNKVDNKYLRGKRVLIEKLFYYYRTLFYKE